MRVKKNFKKIQIFKGFLLSYILILILPFAFGSFVYFKALDIIEKDAKDARIFMLEQSSTIIDNYLKDLNKTVVSMSLNQNLNTLMYMNQPGYGSSDVYYLSLTQKEMKSFSASTTFESSIYVFLKKSDLVMTKTDTVFGIKDYYLTNHYNMPYDTWNQQILDSVHKMDIDPDNIITELIPQNEKRYLTYVQTLPLSAPEKKLGAIVALINTEDINKLLMAVDESKTGYTYIMDRNGRVVTGVSNDSRRDFPAISIDPGSTRGFLFEKINGEEMAVIYTQSQFNKWTYVTALPTKVFLDKAIYIKKVILAIVIISLLIGVGISIYLTRRNIRPIQETMLTLRKVFKGELGNGRNEYDFLKNGVTKLINTHEEMKKSMENQEILMKSTFISRLIHGEINDKSEIEILSEHLDMNLTGKRHIAAIIVLNRFSNPVNREALIEQDINRAIIVNVIEKHIGLNCFTHIIDADQIALLLNFNINDDKECEKIIETIFDNVKNELREIFNINVNFSVGNLYEKVSHINLSFSEAKNTLTAFNEVNTDNSILWYRDVKKESSGYYYPVELELQLINMAKSGNKNDIDRVMDIIYEENFVQRSLTNYMEYNLFFDMRGTIIKIIGDMGSKLDIKEVISSNYSSMEIKDIFNTMKTAYYSICSEAWNKKKSHNSQLLEKLVEYIQSNYFSSEVSACNIAAQFNISESYFSQFFKEQTGETFSDFLEKLRINRACELLTEKTMSVEDTSRLVGYNSAYTFRRAFKRVMGVLPTEYRG